MACFQRDTVRAAHGSGTIDLRVEARSMSDSEAAQLQPLFPSCHSSQRVDELEYKLSAMPSR